MNKLLNTLDKMLEVLSSLAEVMDVEQQQLAAGQVNSRLLQQITEDKHSLLKTLNFIEELRREAEKTSRLHIPYHHHPELSRRWEVIQHQTVTLRDTNLHNGMLLNQQITHNEQMLEVLKPWQSQKFYGPDGQAHTSGLTNRKT